MEDLYILDQKHSFTLRHLQWKLCTQLPCHSSRSCACASADVLWRVYGCRTLLSRVHQHEDIISQCTRKVSGSFIPQIKFKLPPNLMVTFRNPQVPTMTSSLMTNDTDR